ncbi:hypothetical protein D4R42_03830, partial [bacterium]
MPINSAVSLPFRCRIGATQSKGAKNLVRVEPENQRAAGATMPTEATVKGKLVEFSWWMNKQGYAKAS